MHIAKVKSSFLDGTEPFKGIVVASTDFFCAHSFGQDGYDEGELDGYVMLPVDVTFERPARSWDVFAAAGSVGVEADSGVDGASTLLANHPEIVERLDQLGFDGYEGSEVIGNMEFNVLTAWSPSKVVFHPEPETTPDFTVVDGEHEGFSLRAETVRGRLRAHKALWEHATPDDPAYAAIFRDLGILDGFEFDGDTATAPDGTEYVTEAFAIDHLIDHGYLPFTEMVPGLRPR